MSSRVLELAIIAAIGRDHVDAERPLAACASRQGYAQIVDLVGPEAPFRLAERTPGGEARALGQPANGDDAARRQLSSLSSDDGEGGFLAGLG